MKTILIPLLGIFLIGCSPTTSTIPKAPIVAESAVKDLKSTQNNIDKGLDQNKKIDEKLKDQENTINDQKNQIKNALDQAEAIQQKLKEQKEITEKDTFNLIDQIKKVQDRNLFLENNIKELDKTNEEQQKTLEDSRKDAQIALEKLILKEREAKELRDQNEYLSKNLSQKNDEVIQLSTKLSSAAVYKNWVVWILITAIVAFIGYLFLRFGLKYINPF